MNILIVDDEPVELESLRRGLRMNGFTVIEALSGEEALKHLHSGALIDLALVDYSMPEMDGIELLKRIRTEHRLFPVVIVTAYAGKHVLLEALRHGCDGFIEKPFTPSRLMEQIETAKSRGSFRTTGVQHRE